jgi:ABC-type transport system substrate-binding protein
MVLAKNPNFRGEPYPSTAEPGDAAAGLLDEAGKPMPFVEEAHYLLEKEAIPAWNKFLQGYYDSSGIVSDSFDQAIRFNTAGDAALTEQMQDKGIELMTSVTTSIFYMGFNMADDVIGGDSERARKLRQAISIAVNFEDFISIFLNGRGVPAQGVLPPGIFGHRDGEAGVNPYVYDYLDGRYRRKPIEAARRLMAEAGYEDGRDVETGEPLVLYFDTYSGGAGAKAVFDWYRQRFDEIGIQLVIRPTDYNRFQEKIRNGTAQIYTWGWNADYPDPENFFFLLYGPNSKIVSQGENASNFQNDRFDELFLKMKSMPNGPERQAVIDEMQAILQREAPWAWGYYPMAYSLFHQWYGNNKPNLMARNKLKYKRIDPALRAEKRREWNQPVLWPVGLVLALVAVSLIPAVRTYRRRQAQAVR